MQKRLLSLLLALLLTVGCLAGCGGNASGETTAPSVETTAPSLEEVDYAGQVELNMSSATAKEEVTVKQFVDGDTTHFYVPSSVMPGGVLKGRYLAINTPESTGKIEEYGKKASNFTKEKLSTATSIYIESETATWDADSTGSRFLVWVWYKPEGSDTYRNLNIEILQNGLAIASSSANNQYGEICMKAINQAKALKLNVHSGEKDPDFHYGQATELTLKELRCHIDEYDQMKVAFNGVITVNDNGTAYVEDYDPETEMYYGISIYYGYNLTGKGLDIMKVGNEVRIVGTVSYYETGGYWQVSGLEYRAMKPDDPNNIQMLSQGKEAAFTPTDVDTFLNGEVTLTDEEGNTITESYAALAMDTSIQMSGLKVVDSYTTTNEESSSKGAFTLTCQAGGNTVQVRTTVLVDENGDLVTADTYVGKTISVKGIVNIFSGTYQIKVFSRNNIEIQ